MFFKYLVVTLFLFSKEVFGGFFNNYSKPEYACFKCHMIVSDYYDREKFINYCNNGYCSEEYEHMEEFIDFMRDYNKRYLYHKEYIKKYKVFNKNLLYIKSENSRFNGYKLGLNQYTDMTKDEYTKFYRGPNLGKQTTGCNKTDGMLYMYNLPSSVNWVMAKAVTPVKNQQQCGSCWAFSTTGSIEGAFQIKTGKLISLSEQQLVDCSGYYGDNGCSGGLMDNAFDYIIDHGICSENEYNYTARDDPQCNKCKVVVNISGCNDVREDDEDALKVAVAMQPVSVAIEADQSSFQFYKSGVYNDTNCGTNLDHGVLVVGYGTENGMDYWLVKNSWGTTWGDNGYIKIQRNTESSSGLCGIASQPSYPVV